MFGLSYFFFAFWDFRIPVAGIAPDDKLESFQNGNTIP